MSEHIIDEFVTHIESSVADVRLLRTEKLNGLPQI